MLMMLPLLILFAVFVVTPISRSLYLSFTEYNAISSPKWVGFENFAKILQDARFYRALFNTLRYVLISVGISTFLSLCLAMVFSGQSWSDQLFRSLFFLPMVSGITALAFWKAMLSSESYGPLNALMIATGFIDSDPTSLGVIMVAALVTSLPALIFFVLFQRQFVEGIASGATKG